MFPRSCSAHFAEIPHLRRILTCNVLGTTPGQRPVPAQEFFNDAASVLVALLRFGLLLLYLNTW
jgi:hypothetical protein